MTDPLCLSLVFFLNKFYQFEPCKNNVFVEDKWTTFRCIYSQAQGTLMLYIETPSRKENSQ